MNTLVLFLHEIWVRLTLKNPAFFNKIQKIIVVALAVMGSALGWNELYSLGWETITINVFGWVTTLTGLIKIVMVWISAIFVTGQFAVEDTKKLESKVNKTPYMRN